MQFPWANHSETQKAFHLRIEAKEGVNFLVLGGQKQFLRLFFDEICAFFGIGESSLQKVTAIAKRALEKRGHVFSREERKGLQKARLLLSQKILAHNSKKIFGHFKMPRVTIVDVFSKDQQKRKYCVSLKKIRKKTERKLNSPVKNIVRRGIRNEGNTCFAAATLQALFPFRKLSTHEGFFSFIDTLHRVEEKDFEPKDGICEFLNSLSSGTWRYRRGKEDDPVTFFEEAILPNFGKKASWKRIGCTFLEPAILRQKIQKISSGASLQQIAMGAFLKKPFQITQEFPVFFAINIDGRRQKMNLQEEYDDTPISIDYELRLKGECKSEIYSLVAVVMYASHHYYTLEPQYNEQGVQPIFWTIYNDNFVGQIAHSEEIIRQLGTYGYLFFYGHIATGKK